jgi:hypothetical protein
MLKQWMKKWDQVSSTGEHQAHELRRWLKRELWIWGSQRIFKESLANLSSRPPCRPPSGA